MAGIAGWAGREPRLPTHNPAVARALGDEGPAAERFYANPGVALYHACPTELAADTGVQPMISADGRFALAADGEIYNYAEVRAALESEGAQFRTRSDCEVILQGYSIWGADILAHLEGAYAFALHDVTQDEILLARDPVGVRPLFVSQQPFGVAFATRIKAILPMLPTRAAVNPTALVQYLEMQHTLGKNTLCEGVDRLLPGEALLLRGGREQRRWHHWQLPTATPPDDTDPVTALDTLMARVLNDHLGSARSVGVLMSDDAESAITLGLMQHHGVDTVRAIAPAPSDPEALFERLVASVWAADEGVCQPVQLAVDAAVESADDAAGLLLSGAGMTEVFANHPRYHRSLIERTIQPLINPDAHGLPVHGALRGRWVRELLTPPLSAARKAWRAPLMAAWESYPDEWSRLQKMQALEIQHSLSHHSLVQIHRALWTQGIRGRLPFLDRRVVAYGFALPDAMKRDQRAGQNLLRQWAFRFTSAELMSSMRRDASVSLNDWWHEERLARLWRLLLADPAVMTWFRPEGVDALVTRQKRRGDVGLMLFALLQFGVWHRLFIDGDGSRPASRIDPLDFLESTGP